jgi:1-phosphofructokinase
MIITVTLNPAIDKVLDVPEFAVGAHARAVVRSVLPAGKGVNVARGIARLGGVAGATGLVGAGEEGAFCGSLESEGVESRFCTVAGRTRTNTTILDPQRHTSTHLRERGFRVTSGEVARIGDTLRDWLAVHPGATVAFAGSLPDGCREADFAELLAACARQGASVVVDTNGPALRAAVETGAVNAIKPNLGELSDCLGTEVARADALDAAHRLLDRVENVLLTLGSEGAFHVSHRTVLGWECSLPREAVRNTVGCGDAFLAGWLQAREAARDPSEALRWGVATGAASAAGEATVGYRREDVERMLAQCRPLRPE